MEDKAYMLEKLAVLEKGIFSLKKSFEEQVQEYFSLPVAEALLRSASRAQISSTNPELIQKFLKDQQASIKSLRVVVLRVAFIPSNDVLRNISKWFDVYLQEKVVIEFVVDSSLIGGAAIEWNGRYLDYSLKKLLQEKMSNKHKKEKEVPVSV
ncbi:MAG TPA: F0F1 ATP synthase subunit delta [Candidatus Levybacteria bacterium]|nr:F0F1 ATP synthase subunit delta [Candidatus Levybacteria bacterium]